MTSDTAHCSTTNKIRGEGCGEGCPVFVLCPLVLVVFFAAACIIGYDDSAPNMSGRYLRGPVKTTPGHHSRPVSDFLYIGGEEKRRSQKTQDSQRVSLKELPDSDESEEVAAEVDDTSDSGLNLPFALRWPDTHPLIADLHRRRLTFSHEKSEAVGVNSRPALAQAPAGGFDGDDAIASDLEAEMEWPSDRWPEIFASLEDEDEAFGADLPFSLRWPETNPLMADLTG